MKRLISVIGGREAPPDLLAEAERLGEGLARRGWAVVCGGMEGVMEAVCRGAQRAGGTTVGILPGHDPKEANRYVDLALPTGMGLSRNAIVARAGEAVVALGGSHGTLSEIAFALQFGKTVIGIRTWKIEGVREAAGAAEALRALDALPDRPGR